MRISTDIRVIYGDTDNMGHAYYANYLRWFEIGRTEWLRAIGGTYRELESQGVFLPVVESHCRYLNPAYYDDLITVETRFHFESPARLRFDYVLVSNPEAARLAEGYTVHVCLDANRKVIRPPKKLRGILEGAATAE